MSALWRHRRLVGVNFFFGFLEGEGGLVFALGRVGAVSVSMISYSLTMNIFDVQDKECGFKEEERRYAGVEPGNATVEVGGLVPIAS